MVTQEQQCVREATGQLHPVRRLSHSLHPLRQPHTQPRQVADSYQHTLRCRAQPGLGTYVSVSTAALTAKGGVLRGAPPQVSLPSGASPPSSPLSARDVGDTGLELQCRRQQACRVTGVPPEGRRGTRDHSACHDQPAGAKGCGRKDSAGVRSYRGWGTGLGRAWNLLPISAGLLPKLEQVQRVEHRRPGVQVPAPK